MEPFSDNDPLHALLGNAKPIEPRPNFAQNVLRAIRQMPQRWTIWERVRVAFEGLSAPSMAVGGALAGLVVVALALMTLQRPAPQAPAVSHQAPGMQQPQQSSLQPPIHDVSAAMILAATAEVGPPAPSEEMDPMGLLLVQEDTSALTDSELALLLY